MRSLGRTWLDACFRRVPLPIRSRTSVSDAAGLRVVRMVRTYFGQELLPVHSYAVGDTLVDTGLSCEGEAMARFARDAGIRRALLTHHHEDHAGNAALLAGQGVEVLASTETAPLVARGLPIRFYQHVLWGAAPAARATPFAGETVPLGRFEARVVPAPGHCEDQVVFHVPSEGWLFSGDVFIHEHVRLFRGDEDFAKTVATLERLCALDFDALLCAHRPRLSGGKRALREKLDWLRGIEARVRELDARGCSLREIVADVALGDGHPFFRLTLGDVSSANLVRSILYGPRVREEVRVASR